MNICQKELFNVVSTIVPQTAAGDVNGAAVDVSGYGSAFALCHVMADCVGSFILQDSDNGSDFTAVSDSLVVTADGTNTTAAVASSIVTIGYLGTKKYLRVVWDQTTGGEISACIVLGNAFVSPTGTNS